MSKSFMDTYRMPVGLPGRYLDGRKYDQILHKAVRKKWTTDEEKEWWYPKYRAALRKKTSIRFHQQDGKCFYCLQQCFILDEERNGLGKKRLATAEHVIPLSKGGTDHLSNIVMACYACNSLRGNSKFNKFLALRRDRERWAAHCRNIMKAHQEKKLKADEESVAKRNLLGWKIGVLLFVKPEWQVVFDAVVAEVARREAIIRERIEKKQANRLVGEDDLE